MIKSVRLLTFVQICNLFGINEARFTKDPKKKRQIGLVVFVYLYLGVILGLYTTTLCSGLIVNGNEAAIPATIAMSVSAMMFVFTVLRAGPVLFNMKSYENMIVLPVKPSAIVISRFILLYVFDVIYSIVITVTCAVACGMFTTPSPLFYASMILGGFILPLIPMTVAMLLGTVLYALTSRIKKKNAGGVLRTLFLLVFMIGYMAVINNMNGNMNDMANSVAGSFSSASNCYLPALWFSLGANGNVFYFILFIAFSVLIFALAVLFVGKFFVQISSALSSNVSKSNYVLKAQKGRSVFSTLFSRELKRYFSSSIYVSNTLVGYVFAVFSAVFIAFAGGESIFAVLPLEREVLVKVIPFIIVLLCNLSPTTTSAISMEGKTWNFTKSLPVSARDLMNSKLAVNLVLAIPSIVISLAILAVSLQCSLADAVLSLAVTLSVTLFITVLCLYMNVKMPDFSWENEAVPVKQSKCVFIAMILSFTLTAISIALTVATEGSDIVTAVITLVFAFVTVLVYNKLVKVDLYLIN